LLKSLHLKTVGWGVAGIAAVVLGLFVFNQMDSTPPTSPQKQKASLRVFRNKMPAVVNTDTPESVNRVTPEAKEATPRKAAEPKEQPPATEQSTTLAKVPPQRIIQTEVKPPAVKPVTPEKSAIKNTI